MKKVKIEIETENAAFDDLEGRMETTNILYRLAERIDADEFRDGKHKIYDNNGNAVGKITIK